MLKKIIGKLVLLCVIAAMSYMVYTGDFTYLNAITVYYSLLLILYCIMIPIASICTFVEPGGKGAENAFKMFSDMAKSKDGVIGVISWILFAASVILLVMCGYVFVTIAYILATLSSVCFVGSAKKWVNEYHKYKESIEE